MLDGANIKCCLKECVKVQKAPLESLGGRCYDRRYNKCAGGHYERNLCPGDNNVQCCIKDPSGASQDQAPKETSVIIPKCEDIKVIPVGNGGFDHLLYNKETTQLMADVASNVGRVTEVCGKLAGLVKAKQAGLVCDAAGLPVKNIAKHAKECLGKNQCLKIKAYSIPYCVGKEDGCCSSESFGTWVDPPK